ncbi:MAG: hypothetical protein J0M07_28785 [Anaerolineae bacterium]|uniref:hypothetical protein n=1 Tax=Candidatus Flexifilum breve TaxID=3140694 RepID=UPI001AC4A221|nr:hypothetical protein [Chloroflexota bacterium]MBN8639349.1 hypothetical protein [Anaerolineae bacterium]
MSDFEQTTETVDNSSNPLDAFVRHQKKAFEETGKALDALLPPAFKEHSTEARREFVKGVKVLVDAAISEMEKASRDFEKNFNRQRPADEAGDADRPSTTGATKVKVQVE